MKEEDFPEHKASLNITHNGHKDNYETVEEHLEWMKAEDDEWATPTSKERAIKNDSLWVLQIYPNTPVGFYRVYGATFDELFIK